MMGYSLWGHKESDATEHTHIRTLSLTHTYLLFFKILFPFRSLQSTE